MVGGRTSGDSADGDATDAGGDGPIRVVWGTGTGPTALSSYDAALADAGVENYNLVRVSSIVPAGAAVEPVGTAPDLGPAGNRLTVVEARVTVSRVEARDGRDGSDGRGSAGLAWATGPGPGLFYEVAGRFDETECRRRLDVGLDAGRELREWSFEGSDERIVSVDAPAEGFASAVVLGVYGESEPIL
jgi:arginine decarboxylase